MIRESLSIHFQAPMQQMTFVSYLTYLNSAGKITQKSLLEILIVLCEQIEELEKKNDVYEKNFRDIEEILGKLLSKPTSTVVTLEDSAPPEEAPSVSSLSEETKGAFPCDQCDKTFKAKIALAGHKRSHKNHA